MHRRVPRTARGLVVVGLLVALPLAVAGRRFGASETTPVVPPVRRAPDAMPAAIARPAWRPVVGDTLGEVSDFAWLGDTLIVLDARTQRVVLLRPDGAAWRALTHWGRRGGGPGEFQRPAAISRVDGAHVAVLDGVGRIQIFTVNGELTGSERAAAPCVMFAPRLLYDEGGRYLAGNCVPPGSGRDTIYTMLYAATNDGEYRELVRLPRMALDLRWGSAIATLQPLIESTDAIWFGTGLDACVVRLARRPPVTSPEIERRCGLVRERLRADEPADVVEKRRIAQQRGQTQLVRLLRWPEALPPWFGLVSDGMHIWLARPYSADSLAIVPADAPFDATRALLVAPLHGFIACKRGTCLWFDDTRGLAVARPADLANGASG